MSVAQIGYQPNTAADTLMMRLRARLFDGTFAPGQTLSIRQIASAEGVSVIPARDALRGLVAEGALAFRDSRTIVVPTLGAGDLEELRYARLSLECELADRAFAALLPRLGELSVLDDAVTAALLARDVPQYMRTNYAFHFGIYAAAAAPVLLKLTEVLWLRFAPSMRIVCDAFDGHLPRTDYHRAAMSALSQGDQTGFRAAIAADIAQGIDEISAHIDRAAVTDIEKRKTR